MNDGSRLFYVVLFAVLLALWIQHHVRDAYQWLVDRKKECEDQIPEYNKLMNLAHARGHNRMAQTYADLYVENTKDARRCTRIIWAMDNALWILGWFATFVWLGRAIF